MFSHINNAEIAQCIHAKTRRMVCLFLMLLNALDIATVTRETLELGLLESKKDPTRVPLPIIQIWADEQ